MLAPEPNVWNELRITTLDRNEGQTYEIDMYGSGHYFFLADFGNDGVVRSSRRDDFEGGWAEGVS